MKKRVKQVLGALFLAVAIAMTQVPASFVEAISSSADFEKDEDKLVSYTGTAEAVSVPAGIKTICAEAFAGNSFIRSVTIPSSVEVIENGAFRNCANLESVTFHNGLEQIGSGAFAMCGKLRHVSFSETILSLGAGVFAGDDSLKSVDLGNNPYFSCENGVLYDREKTKLIQYFSSVVSEKFVMPDSVTDVERYAFWGCQNLEDVVLSANLNMIPEYAFSNCQDLRSVSIPYSVRKIGAKAFENCVRLGNISMPVSVTAIHATAFDGCENVRILAEEGTAAYEFYNTLKQAQPGDGADAVSDNAIGGLYQAVEESSERGTGTLSENTTNEISESGTYNPRNPADVSDLLVSDYYANDSQEVLGRTRVVGNQAVILPGQFANTQSDFSDEDERKKAFSRRTLLEDEGAHKIRKKAFYQSDALQDVVLADSITDIDDFAFARSSLMGIEIPEGVTHIGYGAFYHCDNLEHVSVPSTVKEIEPDAFARTPYLENWLNSPDQEDFLIVGDGILIAYKGAAGNVYLPETVKRIAGGVFQNHTEIFRVQFDDALTEIGEDAFAGCSQLTLISGMGHVKKIADRAFAGCPLSQIHIGNEVSRIGLGAFSGNAADSITFESIQSLPILSYEQTATRYDNTDYRRAPFGDISVAVVSLGDSFEDTIFDEDYLGFQGLVVSLSGEREDANTTAKLEYCTLLPAPGEENVKVPSSVRIDGKSYAITDADQNAFRAYTRLPVWTQKKVSAVLLPQALGSITDYEPDLVLNDRSEISGKEAENDGAVATADSGTGDVQDNAVAAENGNDENALDDAQKQVQTICLASDYDMAGSITAQVADDEAQYKLFVNRSEDESALRNAVENAFGTAVTGQLLTFDLKMVEKESNIPINTFGEGQVTLTIPISETMYGQQICAVSLAEDESLELLYGTKSESDGNYYFTFRTNHFSPYGIYAGIGNIAEQIREATEALHRQDVSPDTGEKFDPRCMLAIAFGCLGIFLLLNSRKRI